MATVERERTIAAEPTSGALLLAAPAAAELWPGVTLSSAEPGDHMRVSLDGHHEVVLVRAYPPRRTPTSFVIRFTFSTAGLPPGEGELSLTYAPAEDEQAATSARLVLHVPGDAPLMLAALERGAPAFLDNLAAAAEGRSRAA